MEQELNKPIEIAEEIFWVGHYVPNDPFQCHVYLIRNGDESVLIDPGSMITFPVVLEKILQVTSLRNIKYIILHHQDPDIVGCFSTLEQLFPDTKRRFVVTHWRTKTLLKHYAWKTPFYLIDKHDWKLQAKDRELEFIFTPYAHFPGAFCTYDKKTKTVFSSDIFGAISEKFFLFAEDNEDYYKGVELFHKHYIPSNAILNYALDRIEEKKPELIAPQHGSIIRKNMIDKIINRLRPLECGLYILDEQESDIFILNKLDSLLRELFKSILSFSDFRLVAKEIFKVIKKEVPNLEELLIYGSLKEFSDFTYTLKVKENETDEKFSNKIQPLSGCLFKTELITENLQTGALCLKVKGLNKWETRFLNLLLKHIKYALSISLERKIKEEILTYEQKRLQEKANTDPLTKVYNREYLSNYLRDKLKEAKEKKQPLSIAIIDIDYFKKINDNYGHLVGDCVLKELVKILKTHLRSSDCVARYGGEEFVVVMPNSTLADACKKIESLRKLVEEKRFCDENLKVTFSAGVTQFQGKESLEELLKRADDNLYEAKRAGRNRVICS
jgi:diguanylate cyclase (GGDEF)-like protein